MTVSCSTTGGPRSPSSFAAHAVSAAELRLAGDLVEDLEHDRLDEREIARRVAAFGLDPQRRYAALLAVAPTARGRTSCGPPPACSTPAARATSRLQARPGSFPRRNRPGGGRA